MRMQFLILLLLFLFTSNSICDDFTLRQLDPVVETFSEVNSLHFESRNKPPAITGRRPVQKAIFDDNFDTSDFLRIKHNSEIAFRNIDSTWQSMIGLLDNDKYAITVERDSSVANLSVKDMLSEMMNCTITAAIFNGLNRLNDREKRQIPEGFYLTCSSYLRLQNKPLKEILENYRDSHKQFYEIQADAVVWAKRELQKAEIKSPLSNTIISSLELEHMQLQMTKKQVEWVNFFDDNHPLPRLSSKKQ